MQFSLNFSTLLFTLIGVTAAAPQHKANSYVVSDEEMDHWLATTDAKLTYAGSSGPVNPLLPRAAQNTRVVYCSSRVANVCGGACTVYDGGAACLNAPDTQCLSATQNVGFCDRGGCGGSCNQLSTCGTRLDGGFCWTPGTASIVVGPN
ncbi:hypothetical protein NP233_g166 [Leucocoprinus birnbaumii]|uniref:Uncharacterized protein n=1 Tax=Leucocoprinus birnbaumii TaxID=56174 RepID=A0AAD5YWX6_9AGAR|nr:hypothetical protein NP233_g166 [Leucocoprinus birnbaumii]